MPKLWKDTIAEHRRDVRAAILVTAWQLATKHGVLGLTMGNVAEGAGIGRATLYKYFSGVDEILVAAHAAHVSEHLTHLQTARTTGTSPADGLMRMLTGYAQISLHRGKSAAPDLHALVHSGENHQHSQGQLLSLFADAIRAAQGAGVARADIKPDELAAYCVHALEAAADLSSHAALNRLVSLVAAGLGIDEG